MIALMAKQYDEDAYHCVHFAVDAWKMITEQDLSEQFKPLLAPLTHIKSAASLWSGFTEVSGPVSPCVVLMRGGDSAPHMGVYTDGRVLHMRDTGPHAAVIPQLIREYAQMRFFVCEN